MALQVRGGIITRMARHDGGSTTSEVGVAVRTWETIELPILEAVVGMEDAVRSVTVANIAEASGLSTAHVSHGLRRLADGGYVTGRRIHGTGLPFELIGVRATELARRATGQWPAADPYAELMLALELRIDATADLEARGKLERLRDAVAGVGRDVITGGSDGAGDVRDPQVSGVDRQVYPGDR